MEARVEEGQNTARTPLVRASDRDDAPLAGGVEPPTELPPVDLAGLGAAPAHFEFAVQTVTMIGAGVAPAYTMYAALAPHLAAGYVPGTGAGATSAEIAVGSMLYASTMLYAVLVLNVAVIVQANRFVWYRLLQHGVLVKLRRRQARRSRVVWLSAILGASTAAIVYNWKRQASATFVIVAQTFAFIAWYTSRVLYEDSTLVTLHAFVAPDLDKARRVVGTDLSVVPHQLCAESACVLQGERAAAIARDAENGVGFCKRHSRRGGASIGRFAAEVRARSEGRGRPMPAGRTPGSCARWTNAYWWPMGVLAASSDRHDVLLMVFFQTLCSSGNLLFVLIQTAQSWRG